MSVGFLSIMIQETKKDWDVGAVRFPVELESLGGHVFGGVVPIGPDMGKFLRGKHVVSPVSVHVDGTAMALPLPTGMTRRCRVGGHQERAVSCTVCIRFGLDSFVNIDNTVMVGRCSIGR